MKNYHTKEVKVIVPKVKVIVSKDKSYLVNSICKRYRAQREKLSYSIGESCCTQVVKVILKGGSYSVLG